MGKIVKLYSKVKVKNGKGLRRFTLVKPDEIDLSEGKISLESPLGKALINKKESETVVAETPNGSLKYKIIEII